MPPQPTDVERQQRRAADRMKSLQAVEALKTSDGWRQWLGARRHFHNYSLANQLLIALQCPDATRVAGFRSWLKLGYCVRRGEQALRIWVPIPPSKRAIQQWDADGADLALKPVTRFKLGPVFDRSQVDPLPPPAEPVPLDPPIHPPVGSQLAWAFQPLVALAGQLNCRVVIEPMPDGRGGYFEPASRTIALNERNSVNHQIKTLVHELGHALVAREVELGETRLTYSQEELVVESVAYTVCGTIRLDTTSFSIPYLACWSEDTELKVIEQAATLIDEVAKRIEDAVLTAGDEAGSLAA